MHYEKKLQMLRGCNVVNMGDQIQLCSVDCY